MKTKIGLIFLSFFLSGFNMLHAQSQVHENKRHRMGVELLGESFYGNIQYDFRIVKKFNFFLHTGFGYHWEEANYLTYQLGLYYEARLANPNHYIQLGLTKTFFDNYLAQKVGFKPDPFTPYFESWMASLGFVENFGKNWYWRFRVTGFVINKKTLGLEYIIENPRMIIMPHLGFTLGKTF